RSVEAESRLTRPSHSSVWEVLGACFWQLSKRRLQVRKEIITTNGHVCGVDLPKALHLLTATDLAQRVGYRVIDLDVLVEEGLVPLVEHRATAKVLINI